MTRDFFATLLPSAVLGERKAEPAQKCTRLLVRPRGRRDRHVEAADLRDVVVVDLGEDDLLADPERVVAAPVERARAQPPEVADPRSEEHTSELQSRQYLVCRLLLE